MSTSPSWFDQEKFSRLVKKVGPKTTTEVLPSVLGSETEHRPAENLASTARISLVSKPPSLLSEQRGMPALPRRTTPLPNIKALFPTAPPPLPASGQPAAKGELSEPLRVDEGNQAPQEEGELGEIWHKMGLLNEELARTVLERDQAMSEGARLREQLDKANEAHEDNKKETESASSEEVARLTKERDDAVTERDNMRAQVLQAKDTVKAKEEAFTGETQKITIVSGERDQARREYADLRKQYETLKQDQSPRDELLKYRKEWEQQVDELKEQIEEQKTKLEERDKAITALKAAASAPGEADDKSKQEAASLRDQLVKSKDEASVAQRGLALSQKALQQTRDTLREATEGTSLSRHNFDNLKNECAILAQQNTVLQAQVDQLSRDLSANKSKITTRLQH